VLVDYCCDQGSLKQEGDHKFYNQEGKASFSSTSFPIKCLELRTTNLFLLAISGIRHFLLSTLITPISLNNLHPPLNNLKNARCTKKIFRQRSFQLALPQFLLSLEKQNDGIADNSKYGPLCQFKIS